MTVRVIIRRCPLHRVREAFGFFVEERLILALVARLHLRAQACLGVRGWEKVAAERTIHGEVSLPRRASLSPFAQCQIDAQSSNLSRLSSIQKCSLEVTYGRMDSTQSKRPWI